MSTANRSPRQTMTYLRHLFEARGLRPKNKMGQCFLIDLNLVEFIARVAELDRNDLVIEVGSGTGSLTTQLAESAGAVLGIELDAGFCRLARDNTAGYSNVTLLHADILANKNHLNPEVLAAVGELRRRPDLTRLRVVSNLPYVVATPVITNFLLTDLPLERLVVTVQWELAERLAARPSTKDYGSLAVVVQSLADVEIVRRFPPSVFWPRPKVDSGLVLIRPNAAKRAQFADLQGFHRFVRDLYIHRRKNLRGGLIAFLRERFSKEELDERLRGSGFDPSGRAEALTVEEHRKLWEALRA